MINVSFQPDQNLGILYRLVIGYQPAVLAMLFNDLLYLGFYMFLATNFTVTVFRILLVVKVDISSNYYSQCKMFNC